MKVTVSAGKITIVKVTRFLPGTRVSGKQIAPQMADITRGVSSLYVFVDCIESTTADSFSIQLLKTVHIGRGDRIGDLIHYRALERVDAHRLSVHPLRHIQINISELHKRTIDFNGFQVNLTLGFRRTKL